MIRTFISETANSEPGLLARGQSAMERILLACALLLLPAAGLLFVAVPIAYDTIHVPDTLFLADLGWRVHHGLDPVLDFGHFYGGVVAHYIAAAFALFGTSMKSVDYAFALMAITVVGLGIAMSWQRVSRIGALALCMMLAACLLARVPLEMLTAVQRPTASHAFVYNRAAIALAVIMVLFALVPAKRVRADLVMSVLCGILCYGLILLKPTFVVFTPLFLATLAIQARRIALGGAVLGIIVAIALLDPGGARALGAFSYGVAAASGNTTISGMMLKCFAVFLVHPLSLGLVLLIVVSMTRVRGVCGGRILVAALLLGTGFAGMTATMGWLGDVGQQALPFYAVVALACSELLRRHGTAPLELTHVVRLTALALILAFSLPQLAQTSMSGVAAALRQPIIQPTGTPLDRYLAWSDELTDPAGQTMSSALSWDAQIAIATTHLESGRHGNAGIDYIHVIEAARLLQKLPEQARRGIAGDTNGLSYVLQIPPVAGFPAWVNTTAPELTSGQPLPAEVEIMMIRRIAPENISRLLQDRMADDFRPCLQSALWTLSMRKDNPGDFCTLAHQGWRGL